MHYLTSSLQLSEVDRMTPISQIRKLRLNEKIYISSRFTFPISSSVGIRRQICSQTLELWLIIQNSGLDAWCIAVC